MYCSLSMPPSRHPKRASIPSSLVLLRELHVDLGELLIDPFEALVDLLEPPVNLGELLVVFRPCSL